MSGPSSPDPRQAQARQACVACRNQKRKCDRGIPMCSLCTRTGRACDYSATPRPSTSSLETLQSRLVELENRLGPRSISAETPSAVSQFPDAASDVASGSQQAASQAGAARVPSLLFLDVDRFRDSKLRLSQPTVRIPADVLAVLSFGNAVIETTSDYFDTIHTWMPFISHKRMNLGIPLRNAGPDLAMLFLAMKLVTSPPAGTGLPSCDPLYTSAKAFLALFEANGEVSLLCLQAMVLIALYEHGHAVYPTAWMTVGACVRYAEMLGITHSGPRPGVLDQVVTWTELEEQRRLYWAIFVLDRTIALGNRNQFAAAEPPGAAALPADDAAWEASDLMTATLSLLLKMIQDNGDALHGTAYAVSTSYEVPQGHFARLCQSAILVGRAVTARRQMPLTLQVGADHIAGTAALADEILRFDGILAATAGGAWESGGKNSYHTLSPRFLNWSALFVLLDPYCCPVNVMPDEPGHLPVPEAKTGEEIALQKRSTDIVVAVVAKVHEAVRSISEAAASSRGQGGEIGQEVIQQRLGALCPLVLDAVYCVMGLYCWLCQEGGGQSVKDRLADIERFLSDVGERWGLAMEYLRLKKYHDDAGQLGMDGI